MELVRTPFDGGWVGVRDLAESDIEHFVSYWHDGGADLEFLGIDLERLGSREDTRARFRALCRREGGACYTIFHDDRVIGYTNINIDGRRYGYVHVHLTDPGARGRGILSTVLAYALPVIAGSVLDELSIDGLVLETRTRNLGITSVVRKMGLRPQRTAYLTDPDGLAGPGEFHVFVLDRATLAALTGTDALTETVEAAG